MHIRIYFILISLFHAGIAAANSVYPQNPLVEQDAITISSEAVARFDLSGKIKLWQNLDNLQTFEPVDGGENILVGTSRGLYALDKQTGKIRWHSAINDTVFSPSINLGVAYAGSRSGNLYAFRLSDGLKLWSFQTDGWIYSPVLFGELVITGGQKGELIAIERNSGNLRWTYALPNEMVFAPVMGSQTNVLVTTFAGDVIAVDANTGVLRWSLDTATPNASPIFIQGKLIAAGFDGYIRGIDPQTGQLLWATSLGGRISPPVRFKSDQLLVSTDQGKVYRINANTGQMLQQMTVAGETIGSAYSVEKRIVQWVKIVGNKTKFMASKLEPD